MAAAVAARLTMRRIPPILPASSERVSESTMPAQAGSFSRKSPSSPEVNSDIEPVPVPAAEPPAGIHAESPFPLAPSRRDEAFEEMEELPRDDEVPRDEELPRDDEPPLPRGEAGP